MRNSFFCCLLLLATGTSAATTVYEAPYGKAELVDTVEATNVVTEISFMTPEIVNIRRYMKGCDVPQHDLVVTLEKQEVAVAVEHPSNSYTLLKSDKMGVRYYPTTGGVMGVAAAETTATPGPVYNLQGIQMPEGTNLPAGIYIQDNKKFIIK